MKVKKKKKKIKSKTSIEVVVQDTPPQAKGLSEKRKLKIARSMLEYKGAFKNDVVNILDHLERESETTFTAFHKASIGSLLRLVPVAETAYRNRPSESTARALNSYLSQLRELLADVKAERDTKELANRIVTDLVFPTFMRIAQNLHDNMRQFQTSAAGFSDKRNQERMNDLVRDTTRQIAVYMQESARDLTEKLKSAIK